MFRRHFSALELLCATLLVAAGGCSRWNWRGPGFDDGTEGWTEKVRPAAKGQISSGLDARATEIERNLGVR